MHRAIITLTSEKREQMIDVTDELRELARRHPSSLLMALFSRGATSAVMIQENWDPEIGEDILDFLRQLAPEGVWRHDRVDGNADAHIKSGIVGPSETVPLTNGELVLGRWQNIFFCDFDGPRSHRELIVTLYP